MEKDRGGRIIALAALLVGVLGLSLGFAAFSSTLNIETNAKVEVGSKWNVGFSADGTTMAPLASSGAPTVNGTLANTTTAGKAGGSISLMKYTISQATPATISTEENSSVTYNFFIKNAGDVDAALETISFGNLTCEYVADAADRVLEEDESNVGAKVTKETSKTISAEDCATMFTATLTIGGTDYTKDSTTFSNTIAKAGNVAASLTIKSTGTTPTTVPTGDFVVTLGKTTFNYKSA